MMYKVLVILFWVFAGVSAVIGVLATLSTLAAELRNRKGSGYTDPSEAKNAMVPAARSCMFAAIAFLLCDWLLCAAQIFSAEGVLFVDFSRLLVIWGILCAAVYLLSILVRILQVSAFRSASKTNVSKTGLESFIWFSVLFFILAFFLG